MFKGQGAGDITQEQNVKPRTLESGNKKSQGIKASALLISYSQGSSRLFLTCVLHSADCLPLIFSTCNTHTALANVSLFPAMCYQPAGEKPVVQLAQEIHSWAIQLCQRLQALRAHSCWEIEKSSEQTLRVDQISQRYYWQCTYWL